MFPSFYDPKRVGEIYMTRGQTVIQEAQKYKKQHNIQPAAKDQFRICVLGIDTQLTFCHPDASLPVPGAIDDTRRAIEWIYRNLGKITELAFTLDTHYLYQIFSPVWWVDKDGNHPSPFTMITSDDLKSGRWAAISHPHESREYVEKLESSKKYTLMIWPPHGYLGDVAHALVPSLMEAAVFHGTARLRRTHFEAKGSHELTENYSVMSPEVKELRGRVVGGFNTPFFKKLTEFDRIYVHGQAKSHCVLATVEDLLDRMEATDPVLVRKMYVLEDAMSSVPAPPGCNTPGHPANFPEVADRRFAEFRQRGINLVKTADPVVF